MDTASPHHDVATPATRSIDIGRVMEMLPHRYPFLLLDRVIEVEPGGHGVGIKNVTFNEPFFQGHFPGRPVMPGVLVIEAMAQASAVLVFDMLGEGIELETVYFMSVDGAKFRRPVVPGDTLRIHCRRVHSRGNVHRYQCTARVDGTAVAEAQVTAMMIFRRQG